MSILKLCALMEIYMLNDCAAELIVANKERLAGLVDPEHLLNLLTRGVSGEQKSYREYVASYFSPPAAFHSQEKDKAVGLLRRLARFFSRS